eukprot:3634535-Prymnesium_polylepis.4
MLCDAPALSCFAPCQAPWVFTTVWKFISARLDERQRNKINILGGESHGPCRASEEVDPPALPVTSSSPCGVPSIAL